MDFAPADDKQTRKKRILKLSYFFIGILLLLTFFSNTINNFSLPRVTAVQPVSGALIKEASGEGIVQARESVKEYVDQGRLVKEVKVKLGDSVTKGQELILLDSEELERQLEMELLRYDQMRINMEKLTDNRLQNGLSTFDRDIAIAGKKAETAQKELDNAKALFEAGSVSMDEVNEAEMGLLLSNRELDNENAKQRENEKEIRNQQDSLKLEELTIRTLKKKLAEECRLFSPVNGIINELNAEKGTLTNGSAPLFSVADVSKGFELKIPVDVDKAEYITAGDMAEIYIKSLGGKPLEGKVREIAESIQHMGEMKDLLIDLPREGIVGGENCEVYIRKKTRIYNVLVPNDAVGTDDKGKFVWILNEKSGPLGSEFSVRRASIETDDSDSSKTAVLNGLSAEENVIVKYSKSISDGSRVIPDK